MGRVNCRGDRLGIALVRTQNQTYRDQDAENRGQGEPNLTWKVEGQNQTQAEPEGPDVPTDAEPQMELNKEEHGQTHAEQKSQEEEVESLAEEPVESRWEYPRPGTYDLRQQLPQVGLASVRP